MKLTETQLQEIADDLEKGSKYRVAFDLMFLISNQKRSEVERAENFGSKDYFLSLYADCLKAINEADK